MLVFKESLEDYVWTGYQHTSLNYDIAAAGAQTPRVLIGFAHSDPLSRSWTRMSCTLG